MKKWFFLLIGLPVLVGSCIKGTNNTCSYSNSPLIATATEIDSIRNYTTHSGIFATATQHSSGAFFISNNFGTGSVSPEICSNVKVIYSAYLMTSGVVFDSYTTAGGVGFVLGELIVGWQKVLPVLKAGGSMTLFVPPSLAYGANVKMDPNGNVVIPANSYLRFDITLVSVQ
jgi:FKBP-type peptidyl-prolyl cis-trans isomerase